MADQSSPAPDYRILCKHNLRNLYGDEIVCVSCMEDGGLSWVEGVEGESQPDKKKRMLNVTSEEKEFRYGLDELFANYRRRITQCKHIGDSAGSNRC